MLICYLFPFLFLIRSRSLIFGFAALCLARLSSGLHPLEILFLGVSSSYTSKQASTQAENRWTISSNHSFFLARWINSLIGVGNYNFYSSTSHYISVSSKPHNFVRRLVSCSGLLPPSHLLLDKGITAGRLGKELVQDELVIGTPPEVRQTETIMTIKDAYVLRLGGGGTRRVTFSSYIFFIFFFCCRRAS